MKILRINDASRSRLIRFACAFLNQKASCDCRNSTCPSEFIKLKPLTALAFSRMDRSAMQRLTKAVVTDAHDHTSDLLTCGMLLRQHGLCFTEGDLLDHSSFNRGWWDLIQVLTDHNAAGSSVVN